MMERLDFGIMNMEALIVHSKVIQAMYNACHLILLEGFWRHPPLYIYLFTNNILGFINKNLGAQELYDR